MKSRLGISPETFKKTATELNQLLASYQVYYQNLRNCHWNIRGKHFFELHRQFEEMYIDAREKIDALAERLLTIHYRPLSDLSEYVEHSQVKEMGRVVHDREMIMNILDNHRVMIKQMRTVIDCASDINDEGTIDMVASDLENLEKRSWMLEAWAEQVEEPVYAN